MAKVKKFGFGGMLSGRGRPMPQQQPRPMPGGSGLIQQAGAGLASMSPAERQRLQQVQSMVSGTPVTRQVMQPQAPQMPTAQTNATQAPTSVGNQLRNTGLAGASLQQQLGGAGSLANLPSALRDPMKPMPAGMKKGVMVKSSASKRADGCAVKGKTRGKMM